MRDLAGLTRVCQGLLLAQALLCVFSTGQTLVTGLPAYGENDLLLAAQFLLGCATAVAVLTWVYRSTANAHASGASGLGAGPGLAVAWYFIPIVNLFKPVATMAETWKASIDPADWETVRTPAGIGWWWAFWLISSIAGTAAWRVGEIGEDGSGRWAAVLNLVSDAAFIPASLILARILGTISAQQASIASRAKGA